MLNLFRALTSLRRVEPALSVGNYASVDSGAEEVLAYVRTTPGSARFLVVLNFGSKKHSLNLSQVARQADIAVATDMVRRGEVALSDLALGPNEGLVLRLH